MSDPEARPLRVDRLPLDDAAGRARGADARPAGRHERDRQRPAGRPPRGARRDRDGRGRARRRRRGGAADRAFCAGMDLKERAGFSDDDLRAQRAGIVGLIGRLHELPVPTVAAVDGIALGGGFELALACDLIVAGAGATFGLPEVRVGIFPGGGSTQTLTWLVGPARARDVILTGRRLSATEAEAWGVVARVVEGGTARDRPSRWRDRSPRARRSASARRRRRSAAPTGRSPRASPPRTSCTRPCSVRRPARGVQRVRGEAPAAVHRPLAPADVDLGRRRHAAPAGRLLAASRRRGPGDRAGAARTDAAGRSRPGRREASGSSTVRSTGQRSRSPRRRGRASRPAPMRSRPDTSSPGRSRAARTAACSRARSPPR